MCNLARMMILYSLFRIPYLSIGSLVTGYSKLQYGFRLEKCMINSYVELSILDCVKECLRTTRCQSVSYYRAANYCELHYEDRTTAPGRLVEGTEWVYSERRDWYKNVTGPCSNKQCGINEKCIMIGRTATCQLSDCGPPFTRKISAESVETWDGIGIKRRIHVKCTDEYNQTGNGIFICNGNGKWNSNMVCNGKRLGCFEDNETRSFDPGNYHRLQNMDASVCRDHCLEIDKEFKYIGLQHGSACFCGHHIKFWNRRSDNECYINCPGNKKETCGGDWRNEIFSV